MLTKVLRVPTAPLTVKERRFPPKIFLSFPIGHFHLKDHPWNIGNDWYVSAHSRNQVMVDRKSLIARSGTWLV